MKNKIKIVGVASLVLLLAGCGAGEKKTQSTEKKEDKAQTTEQTQPKNVDMKGVELTKILGGTNWQGTKVYDKNNNDLTKENENFIGLAKYDAGSGRYEFFDAKTGKSRDDRGTFFITNDGDKRILISDTKKYQAVVKITELTNKKFIYSRMGKDKDGKDVEVLVEHIPYDKELTFTEKEKPLNTSTGTIETAKNGSSILGETLWNGSKVVDEKGNDVTEYNKDYISLAKFDATTSKYEFFNLDTGITRGDYGYFDVINHNKIRAHVSIGAKKYGAVLELTELNDKKFTYTRMGKDKDGKDIKIFVEHIPYTGKLNPTFTF